MLTKKGHRMGLFIDKVKGTIYGQAIGDALGLGTEFMSKEEMEEIFLSNDSVMMLAVAKWLMEDGTHTNNFCTYWITLYK